VAEVWFTLPKAADEINAVCGEDGLALYNEPMRTPARSIVEALLARHADNWQCGWIASRQRGDEALLIVSAEGPHEEIECSFREFALGRIKLPLEDLAVVIEGSSPKICRYREHGEDLSERRFRCRVFRREY